MQSKLAPRGNNTEARFEGTGLRQEFEARRKLARLKRRDRTQYALVRWNCNAGPVDMSEGLLSDRTVTWHTTAIWIDGFNSLPFLQPMIFGDVIYEVEPLGIITRGGTTRQLFLPTQMAFVSAGSRVGDLTIAGSGICDTSVSTSFMGSNRLPISTSFTAATNAKFRAGNAMHTTTSPLLWSIDYVGSSVPIPLVIPVSQSGPVAFKEASAFASLATSVTVSGLTIDSGEPFDVFGAVANSAVNPKIYTNTVVARGTSAPGVGTVSFTGFASGAGLQTTAAGQASSAADVNAGTPLSWYNANMSLTLSASVDATTKRILSVTMSVANQSNLALSVRGGM